MRRGFVLLAVMIGLSLTMLVTLALLQLAQTESSGAHYSTGKAQSHALMRSGIDAIAGRLATQHEAILVGQPIELDEQYTIYEANGRLGVVRLLPVGRQDELFESESGKLDINEVSAEQLVATGLVEEAVAQRIIQFRNQELGGTVRSINELAEVPGVTNEILFGSMSRVREQLARVHGNNEQERRGGLEARRERMLLDGADDGPSLADILTVFSIESNVMHDGTPRTDLSKPRRSSSEAPNDPNAPSVPSEVETFDGPIDPSFGFGANPGEAVEPEAARWLRERRPRYGRDSEIAEVLRSSTLPIEDWAEYFDTCTTTPGELRAGRIDINTASAAALLGIPNMTVEHAEAIVAAQGSLSDAERATVCWPMLQGIMQPEAFALVVDHMTHRSCCYRMRLAAGDVSEDDPDGPLRSPVICEVVFDLASPAPHVAYLRDFTMLPTMLAMASEREDEVSGVALRLDDHALADEIEAWNERFEEREREDEVKEDEGEANELSRPAPHAGSGSNRSAETILPDAPGAVGESATGNESSSPTVRRIGRWLGS